MHWYDWVFGIPFGLLILFLVVGGLATPQYGSGNGWYGKKRN
jgi:hypothetical protein